MQISFLGVGGGGVKNDKKEKKDLYFCSGHTPKVDGLISSQLGILAILANTHKKLFSRINSEWDTANGFFWPIRYLLK